MKIVPGTKCYQNIFQNFFRPKNKVFGPIIISKKTFFEFFSSISWGLSTGIKCEKAVLFRSGNYKGEKNLNSPLVPVLNPKRITFFGIGTDPKTLFLDLKKLWKNFWKHLVPGTSFSTRTGNVCVWLKKINYVNE